MMPAYLTDRTLAELAARDRLRQVLVRCGGCRFIAPAQDAARIIAAVEASGDYVRDVSIFMPPRSGDTFGSPS
jgi:hypothetical protein